LTSDMNSFTLRVDFVHWPYDYLHHVSERHLVLGARYLAAAHEADLSAVLRAAIMPLV